MTCWPRTAGSPGRAAITAALPAQYEVDPASRHRRAAHPHRAWRRARCRPGLDIEELSLEDVVLAYMGRARDSVSAADTH